MTIGSNTTSKTKNQTPIVAIEKEETKNPTACYSKRKTMKQETAELMSTQNNNVPEPAITMPTVTYKLTMTTRDRTKMFFTPNHTKQDQLEEQKYEKPKTTDTTAIGNNSLPATKKARTSENGDSENDPPTSSTIQTGPEMTTYTVHDGQYRYTASKNSGKSRTTTYGGNQKTQKPDEANGEKDDRNELHAVISKKQKPESHKSGESESTSENSIRRHKT